VGGMASGPWSYPTELPLFAATWVAMAAAMMLPAVAPTVLAYQGRVRRRRGRRAALGLSLAFVAAYLAVWALAGLVPYALLREVGALDGRLFMGGPGRALAGGVLVAAAAYQLLPAKRACLRRLCGPPDLVGEEAPGGAARALGTGLRSGAWCLGCCWGLMAGLFALGLMDLTWMVVIWALIMGERLLPRPRLATAGVASVLVALAVAAALGP
jgi:predicted metal-binding membrane protein